MNLGEYKEHFEENGFVILPNHFPQKLIDNLSLFTQTHIEALPEDEKQKEQIIIGRLFEKDHELFYNFFSDPFILQLIEQIMGPFIQLDGLTIVQLKSLSKGDEQEKRLGWHRDPWSHIPKENYYLPPLCVNLLSYLQDIHSETGPLRIIPGSHRFECLMSAEEVRIPHPKEKLLYLKKGDVVLLHHLLVHSRTMSITSNRTHISVLYNHSWLKQSTKFGPNAKQYIERAFMKNDIKTLRLFGIDIKLSERANSQFLNSDEEMWRYWSNEDKSLMNIINE